MYGAHIMSSPPTTAVRAELEQLDHALVSLRRLWQHRRLQQDLAARTGTTVQPALIRTLRAVELSERDEPCVGDVADALAVDPSTASRYVDQAVRDELVERTPSPADRRRAVLRVTAQGADLLEHANAARVAFLAELTDDWSAGDVRSLATLLDRLRAATLSLGA